MERTSGIRIIIALLCAIAVFASFGATAGENDKALARAVAEYLVAARAVIANNQDLINDPSKGEQRFAPARYGELVRKEFGEMSKIDLGMLKASTTDVFASSLLALHQSALDVVAEFQQRINTPGAGFKGVHPAVFGARVGQEFYKRSGIRLKQTSLKYRADYNKPDDFETAVLKSFEAAAKAEPRYAETALDGRPVARYMAPLYISKVCLGCHGDPAGELDVTGRSKEGYKEGMLRGAISVVVPMR